MSVYSFSGKQFDPQTFQLKDEAGERTLRAKTAGLLWLFLKHPGEPLSRQFLLDENWDGMAVGDHVLSETLRELRAVLGDSPRQPRFIRTIPKHGYQWILTDIEETQEPPAPMLRAPEVPENPIRVGVPEAGTTRKRQGAWLLAIVLIGFVSFLAYRWKTGTNVAESALESGRDVRENRITRLGVLPLQDGVLDEAWFEDGYQDLLLVALSELEQVEIADGKSLRTQVTRWQTKPEANDPWDAERLAQVLGLTDILEIQVTCEGNTCRTSYKLRDGGGSLQQKGRFSTENLEEAVMTLAGILAKNNGRPANLLPVFQILEGSPQVQTAFTRGMHYASAGMPKRAAEQFQFCLRLVPSFHWARYKLANAQFKMGEIEASQELLQDLLDQPGLSKRLLSHVKNSLGAQQLNRGEVGEAAASFEAAASQFLKLGDRESHLKSLGNQAVAAVYQRDTETAMGLLKQGLRLAERTGLKSQKAQFLSRLAGIQLMGGGFGEARTNLNQARQLYRQIGNLAGVAEINNNLGAIGLEENQPAKAQTYFTLAWQQYEDLGQPIQAALALHNQGTCAFMLEDYALAEKLTRTAKDMRERNQDRFGLGESYVQFARIHAARGMDGEGVTQLRKADDLFTELGRPDITQHYAEKIILHLLEKNEKPRTKPYLAFYPDAPARPPGLEVTLLLAEQAQIAGDTGRTKALLDQAQAIKPMGQWPEKDQTLFASLLENAAAKND